MKKWVKGTLIGLAITATVAMLALRFGGFAIPSILWLATCLVGHGTLMFLLMGMFTKDGSSSNEDNSPSSTNIGRQNNTEMW